MDNKSEGLRERPHEARMFNARLNKWQAGISKASQNAVNQEEHQP
jgi:hypothetical protein